MANEQTGRFIRDDFVTRGRERGVRTVNLQELRNTPRGRCRRRKGKEIKIGSCTGFHFEKPWKQNREVQVGLDAMAPLPCPREKPVWAPRTAKSTVPHGSLVSRQARPMISWLTAMEFIPIATDCALDWQPHSSFTTTFHERNVGVIRQSVVVPWTTVNSNQP